MTALLCKSVFILPVTWLGYGWPCKMEEAQISPPALHCLTTEEVRMTFSTWSITSTLISAFLLNSAAVAGYWNKLEREVKADWKLHSLLTLHQWIFTQALLHSPMQKWQGKSLLKAPGAELKLHCVAAAETEWPGVLGKLMEFRACKNLSNTVRTTADLKHSPSKPGVLPLALLP